MIVPVLIQDGGPDRWSLGYSLGPSLIHRTTRHEFSTRAQADEWKRRTVRRPGAELAATL